MDRKEELRNYMTAARALFDGGIGEAGRAQDEVAQSQFYESGGRHLSNDEMIAFCQERMAAAEREAARPHILQCDKCLQLFKDVNDFFKPWREDEVEIGELQVRRAWKEFSPQVRDMIGPSRRRFPPAIWSMAAAAGLLLMLGLAAVFVWREKEGKERAQRQIAQLQDRQQDLEARLSQTERTAGNQLEQERERRAEAEARVKELQIQLDGLRQSQQNIPVYSIESASIRGQQEDSLVSITPATRTFILSLDIYNPNEFPEYVVEIFDQHGQRVKEISGLRPVGIGKALNMALDRGSLKEGKHLLRLSGRRGGAKKKLEESSLSLSFSR
jgi:hypothetical protein